MKIHFFNSEEEAAEHAFKKLQNDIRIKPGLKLCAATGNSPRALYGKIIREANRNPSLFSALQLIQLDEWVGLANDDKDSCAYYLQQYLINPLKVTENRFHGFNGKNEDPEQEVIKMKKYLSQHGPIDYCILGVGKNGHLGFNEPGTALNLHTHVAKLTPASQAHQMIAQKSKKPQRGITLGIADIITSRKIIVILTGDHKEQAREHLSNDKVSTQWPVTLLKLHSETDVYILPK